MNKKCARPECGKTVYPIEEIKCLDKVWHKGCFKCAVCGMTLNMKNYKGYNKTPYCEPHYPKTVASVVADTPEMRRLAENTKLQSQAKYHEDFEKMKGKKIELAEDPEMMRCLKNTQVISNVKYHGELEKRIEMEKSRPPLEETANRARLGGDTVDSQLMANQHQHPAHQYQQQSPPQQHHDPRYPTGLMADLKNSQNPGGAAVSPYTAKTQQTSTLIYSSEQGGRVAPQTRPVGSIADYDPMNGQWGSATQTARANPSSVQYCLDYNVGRQPGAAQHQPQQQQQQHQQAQPVHHQPPPQADTGARRAQPQGVVVRALYDYAQADSDEVSFDEGDLIVGCQSVDEGWMTGTVQKTGQWGMLPANYVERVH